MTDFAIDVVDGRDGPTAAAPGHLPASASRPARSTVEDTIELTRAGRTWRLAEVAVPVTDPHHNGSSRATFVGADIPDGVHLLFPGALPVEFDTENLALDEETRVVRFAQDGRPRGGRRGQRGRAGGGRRGARRRARGVPGRDRRARRRCARCRRTPARVPGSLRGTVTEPASEIVADPDPGRQRRAGPDQWRGHGHRAVRAAGLQQPARRDDRRPDDRAPGGLLRHDAGDDHLACGVSEIAGGGRGRGPPTLCAARDRARAHAGRGGARPARCPAVVVRRLGRPWPVGGRRPRPGDHDRGDRQRGERRPPRAGRQGAGRARLRRSDPGRPHRPGPRRVRSRHRDGVADGRRARARPTSPGIAPDARVLPIAIPLLGTATEGSTSGSLPGGDPLGGGQRRADHQPVARPGAAGGHRPVGLPDGRAGRDPVRDRQGLDRGRRVRERGGGRAAR